jgi:hypothetical protein
MLVAFGSSHKSLWPETVEIKEGATLTLRAGGLRVRSAKSFTAVVKGSDGQVASEVSSGIPRVALPPGKYTLELESRQIAVELSEGRDVEIKLQ